MEHEHPDLRSEILAKLRSKRATERQRAEEELKRLGPEAVEALLATLEQESLRRKRRRMAGFAILFLAMTIIVATIKSWDFPSLFGSLWGGVATLFAATQLQKDAVLALSRYDDVRGVGFLAEALEFDDKVIVRQAGDALVRLLPRLRASDHSLLTDEQRRCLDRALERGKRRDLCLAILGAYEQIGDAKSIEVVERLASARPGKRVDEEVRRRAAEVLPALRERAELVRAAQTLLRPAEAGGSDTLLRPAGGPPQTPDDRLLRPVAEAVEADRSYLSAESEAPEPLYRS